MKRHQSQKHNVKRNSHEKRPPIVLNLGQLAENVERGAVFAYARLKAHFLHALNQIPHGDCIFPKSDFGLAREQVDGGAGHSRSAQQHALDGVDTGRAGHAANVEHNVRLVLFHRREANLLHRLHNLLGRGLLAVVLDLSPLSQQRHRHSLATERVRNLASSLPPPLPRLRLGCRRSSRWSPRTPRTSFPPL